MRHATCYVGYVHFHFSELLLLFQKDPEETLDILALLQQ